MKQVKTANQPQTQVGAPALHVIVTSVRVAAEAVANNAVTAAASVVVGNVSYLQRAASQHGLCVRWRACATPVRARASVGECHISRIPLGFRRQTDLGNFYRAVWENDGLPFGLKFKIL